MSERKAVITRIKGFIVFLLTIGVVALLYPIVMHMLNKWPMDFDTFSLYFVGVFVLMFFFVLSFIVFRLTETKA